MHAFQCCAARHCGQECFDFPSCGASLWEVDRQSAEGASTDSGRLGEHKSGRYTSHVLIDASAGFEVLYS